MKKLLLATTLALMPVVAQAATNADNSTCRETTAQYHAYLDKQGVSGVGITASDVTNPSLVRMYIAEISAHMGKPPFNTDRAAQIEFVARSDAPTVFLRVADATGCTLGSGHLSPDFVSTLLGRAL